MKTDQKHFLAALALGLSFALSPASAESLPTYDPVVRAITLGLTPEVVDVAFDTALAQAEICDAASRAFETVSCPSQDIAVNGLLQSPIMNAGS